MMMRGSSRLFSTDRVSRAKVGFVGLGNMGRGMALNLIKAGHTLTVFDLYAPSVAALVEKGAKAASSPKVLAESGLDAIVTMLPSSPHVKDVYMGENGLLAGLAKNSSTLLLDSSTIDPAVARTVAAAAAAKNIAMIDSPVSGGTAAADAGTLTFMVGGSPADFERGKKLLESMGKKIVHCGASGAGQITKVCNNMVLAISMIGVSEAMNIGIKLGMDPKTLASVINTSSGRCWSSDTYNPVPGVMDGSAASRGYTGGFYSDLMKKDLGLAMEAAAAAKAPAVLGGASLQIYQMLSNKGMGGMDFSSVYKFLSEDMSANKK
jgi:3-hydroxyisobutyrate dehydrogenase